MNEREGAVVRKRAAGNHEISLGSISEAAAKVSQVFDSERGSSVSVHMERWQESE